MQNVQQQINAETVNIISAVMGQNKAEPRIQRCTYWIDREPQCEALLKHVVHVLQKDESPKPLCIIASGTREDLPQACGTTLIEFASRNLVGQFGWNEFLPPHSPFCQLWPARECDSGSIWNIIGQFFLGLRALESPEAAKKALSNHPRSIGFGFHFELDLWPRHAATLRSWIDSLQHCSLPPKTLVLAIVVLSTSSNKRSALHNLVNDLRGDYQDCGHVLVLPPLGPVSARDLEKWRQELFEEVGSRLDEVGLETLVLELFPDAIQERCIGEIWDKVRRRVTDAWMR